jgi:hydroxyacylglutathione hydrolase
MTVNVQPVPMLTDNYAWLLRDGRSGATALVDPPDARAGEAAVQKAGGRLDMILLTHHHADHTAGTDELRARYGCRVVGARIDAHRLPALDRALEDGDIVAFGASEGRVIFTPGHTSGHICFFFDDGAVLACGATLFALGCGRLLEGTAEQMFHSLGRLKTLPPDTLVCCGHEYTLANAAFALSLDPQNEKLWARERRAREQRGLARHPEHGRALGHQERPQPLRAPDIRRFAEIRAAKDRF